MTYQSLEFFVDDQGIAWLTLARPEVSNALNETAIDELQQVLTTLHHQADVRLLLLTGKGKHFCAGADLQWMQASQQLSEAENFNDAKQLATVFNQLYTLPVPTVAVLDGAVMGGGVGLVACCDLAIATFDTFFCLSEVKLGLIPALISPYLSRKLPSTALQRYAFTAERFTANKAAELGLITEVIEKAALATLTQKYCKNILNNAPQALRKTKSLLQQLQHPPIDQALIDQCCNSIASTRVGDEAQQGIQAFFNKTDPPWKQK